jgi:hypothetical protein
MIFPDMIIRTRIIWMRLRLIVQRQPTLSSWEEEAQLSQYKKGNQTLHTNQDCKEENAENFPVNAKCLPLCFASLLREHCKQIVNRKDDGCSNASFEENKDDTKVDP